MKRATLMIGLIACIGWWAACRNSDPTTVTGTFVQSADGARSAPGWLAEIQAALGFDNHRVHTFSGYVDADYVFVTSTVGGTLARLAVARGDHARKGALLFQLDDTAEIAARNQAQAQLSQARAELSDLLKGRRAPEIDAITAQRIQAEASLHKSEADYRRYVQLHAAGAASDQQLDDARAKRDNDRALVKEFAAQVRTARLPGREDQVRAAEFAVDAARHSLAQADWRLSQMSGLAPADSTVIDTLYRPGEMVVAGQPVVQLLPPEYLKLRFFVPETMVGAIKVGEAVQVACDGCYAPFEGTIRFISPRAEFTPPVIYSREQRSRLIFMVEARPNSDAQSLQVGQPIDVAMEMR